MAGYSYKAQPFLDAIASAMFNSQECRNRIVTGTPAEASYLGSEILFEEQRAVRWKSKPTKQPFWANYWCGLDARCACRGNGTGIESDAIFFMRNTSKLVLAVHVEFKHPKEKFGLGQQEAYSRRAQCFRDTFASRPAINPHHDWATVIFCDNETALGGAADHFQRVVTHTEAREFVQDYPAS